MKGVLKMLVDKQAISTFIIPKSVDLNVYNAE